jgi:hypothetical protein
MAKKKAKQSDLVLPKSLDKKWEELENLMKQPKYQSQMYGDDTEVSIKGKTFATLLNSQQNNTRLLLAMMSNLEASLTALKGMLNDNDSITLELLSQHIKNVDAGITTEYKPEPQVKEPLNVAEIARGNE